MDTEVDILMLMYPDPDVDDLPMLVNRVVGIARKRYRRSADVNIEAVRICQILLEDPFMMDDRWCVIQSLLSRELSRGARRWLPCM